MASSIAVGGKKGQPIETEDVTNEELARRIAFILGQAARDKAALIKDAGNGGN